ncbi:MAG: hypothetical protein ABI859_07300, partial [Pseudomonadota bacterium]
VRSNVIRFLAPLTISDAVLDEGMDLLAAALDEVTGRASGAAGSGAAGVGVGGSVKVLAV